MVISVDVDKTRVVFQGKRLVARIEPVDCISMPAEYVHLEGYGASEDFHTRGSIDLAMRELDTGVILLCWG